MFLLTNLRSTVKFLLSPFLILSTVICQAQLLSFVKGADGSVFDFHANSLLLSKKSW